MAAVHELLTQFAKSGWASALLSISHQDALHLKQECSTAYHEGDFHQAGVGRGESLSVQPTIRGDQIMWLDPETTSTHQARYLAKLESLRLLLNEQFFLGLFNFEGHFAIYPEGAFYKPHLDQHAHTQDRIVTVILYLNPDWEEGDGGELKIWTEMSGKDGPFQLIQPRMGTMVCFLADQFWHEVLPANKSRSSITGWFRQRTSL